MKLACSSTAFDVSLRSGELTQLEWIDACAHELSADGVVFDVRHFPRTDTDYLAQVKKMSVDFGLTVAALRADAFFENDPPQMLEAVTMALALGAPVLSAPMPLETALTWSAALERLGTATSLAKEHNVTLAVRNAPHTFAATTHDMKRVAKEADSAWLRYGPHPGGLDAASQAEPLLGKAVLVWEAIDVPDCEQAAGALGAFNGFIALDNREGTAEIAATKNALRRWRRALFAIADRT